MRNYLNFLNFRIEQAMMNRELTQAIGSIKNFIACSMNGSAKGLDTEENQLTLDSLNDAATEFRQIEEKKFEFQADEPLESFVGEDEDFKENINDYTKDTFDDDLDFDF